MMAQSRTESTRDTYNYGQYINQFPPNTIKVIREFERIQKKICRHKMSIMFNEICIYICIYISWFSSSWWACVFIYIYILLKLIFVSTYKLNLNVLPHSLPVCNIIFWMIYLLITQTLVYFHFPNLRVGGGVCTCLCVWVWVCVWVCVCK